MGGLKDDIKTKLAKINARSDSKVAIIKLFMTSLEYQRIQNFPQHGLQLLAEVGGIMAFFLGISMISILECVCYFFYKLKKCCCSCMDNTNEDEAEHVEQFQITPNGDLRAKQSRLSIPGQTAANQFQNGYEGAYPSQPNYRNNGSLRRPDLSHFDERDERS